MAGADGAHVGPLDSLAGRPDHARTMPLDVIARGPELATVHAFLDPAQGPRALVLEGEAGIGKSTLWSAGVAVAGQRFRHVLTSRPAETERSLANVVLGDLFGEIQAEVLAVLPGARRRAFEAALLAGEADDTTIDPRALAAAALTALAALAAQGPVLLAVDDDQWADRSSVAALDFALRRLRGEPIRLLLARRIDGGPAQASGLDRAVEAAAGPESRERLRVGPLSIGAIQALLQQRLGFTMSRPNLVRLAEASGGNPFFALELARAQPAAGGPPTALVVPPSLQRLVAERLDQLDAETRRALLLVAAHGRASNDLLRRLGLESGLIDRASERELLEASAGAVRFSHPVLASTVYQRASTEEQRAAHLELAGVVDDPLGRARHLALATAAPDDAVAAKLESAAMVARTRGLPIVAAELAEHARRLTLTGQLEDSLRRGAIAAWAHLAAGEPDRARAIVSTQLAEAPSGPQRAEALILAAELEEPGPAVALLEQALDEASGAPGVEATVRTLLADDGRLLYGRAWAEAHARAGLEAAERLDDELLRTRAMAVLSELRFEDGDPEALDLAREAYRRAVAGGDPEAIRIATWAVGHQLMWLRRNDEARAWFEAALTGGEQDELLRAVCLYYLAFVELSAGRWELAWGYGEEAAAIDAQYGIERPQDHLPLALVALHRGQLALAREHSSRAIALAEGMLLPAHTTVLGIADLWSGHPDDALTALAHAEELTKRRGIREASLISGRAEHIEAMLQTGRVDEAERLISGWEAAAIRGGRDWSMAEVIRSRGLLAAARGELDRAAERLEEAARRHETVGDPFGRGRALLAIGGVRRRQRRKRLAKEALEAARAVFESLGAAGFAEAARRELGQLGGRQRFEGLSPSERRVAELVAEGRSNREIATLLFLGERTVASHLTHAYAKLGVRSRIELARELARAAAETGKVPTS
jgi:DNA-binding CsgD family transcriptional regulator